MSLLSGQVSVTKLCAIVRVYTCFCASTCKASRTSSGPGCCGRTPCWGCELEEEISKSWNRLRGHLGKQPSECYDGP